MDVPMNNTLKVKLDPGAFAPVRAHEDDAGLDIFSPLDIPVWPFGSEIIDTGVHVQIPKGYVGRITSKSSLMQEGIITTATIDSGYTGSIKVVLFNLAHRSYSVKTGQKIAQLVIHPIITPKIIQVDELEETERGDGGFGSTGAYASEEEFEAAVQRNLARLYEEQERRKAAEGVNDGKV